MIIFYLPVILFGLFSVYASEFQESVQKINALLPADQQYPDLSALFSDKKSWENLEKLRATPTNIETLIAIYKQVYAACKTTCVFVKGAYTNQLKTSCQQLVEDVNYCGRLESTIFDPEGKDPEEPFHYDEYVEQVLTCFKMLSSAKKDEKNETKGIISHLSTPAQFADALVKVLKDNLGSLTFTEDPELITKLNAACGVKGKSDGGKNPNDPNLGNKDQPWSTAEKIGVGVGIGAVVIVTIIIIVLIVKRKK
jgi:hypothetical protein